MPAPDCPVCGAPDAQTHLEIDVAEAARGFAAGAPGVSPGDVEPILRRLWGDAGARVLTCRRCGFGFADPQVAGDAAFYTLLYGNAPSYPADRWEFAQTMRALEGAPTGRLLEIGAGDGRFLRHARAAGWETLAVELGAAAVAALRADGYPVEEASIDELAGQERHRGAHDAVCLFQTLEHLAAPREALTRLASLLAPGGRLFVSVPNGPHVLAQEALTQMLDLPPNHVGRWTPEALRIAGEAAGLAVVAVEEEPADQAEIAAHLAHLHRVAHGGRGLDRFAPTPLRSWAERVDISLRVRAIARRGGTLPAPTLWASYAKAAA
ncbi:MAG: class I SAM-dependent methyltransferase [Solirubrobacteraceae bacterium]